MLTTLRVNGSVWRPTEMKRCTFLNNCNNFFVHFHTSGTFFKCCIMYDEFIYIFLIYSIIFNTLDLNTLIHLTNTMAIYIYLLAVFLTSMESISQKHYSTVTVMNLICQLHKVNLLTIV